VTYLAYSGYARITSGSQKQAALKIVFFFGVNKNRENGKVALASSQTSLENLKFKVPVYSKIDHFSEKLFFAFSDKSYCDLSFKKKII